jgi:plastocyanin
MSYVAKLGRVVSSILVVAASLVMLPLSAAPVQAAADPVTWTVLVGAEGGLEQIDTGTGARWEFLRFYPDSITIDAGDTIVFKLNSMEPHTVTFPKPGDPVPPLIIPEGGTSQRMLINSLDIFAQGGSTYDGSAYTGSGQLGGDPTMPTSYSLTFPTAGTYDYGCAFHSQMKGKVIVQAAGSAYPKTQAQIDADAKALIDQDTAAALKMEPTVQQVSSRPGPNGTTIWSANVGYGDGTYAYMRFSPKTLTIHAGDTVEWTQKDVETPHTVTFVSGGTEPDFAVVEPQPNGPPKVVFNPVVLAPAGGSVYSGQGYFNSGLLQGTESPAPGPRSYSLVFDTPGAYEYICVLHDPLGMSGIVTVLPQGAQLPASGQGPGFGGDVLAAFALGLVLVLAGTAVRRLASSRS